MNKELILELKSYIEINKIDSLIVREAVINQDNIMPMKSINRVDELQNHKILPKDKQEIDKDFLEQFRKKPRIKRRDNSKSYSIMQEEEKLEDYINKKKSEETFSSKLLEYIDDLGLSDAEIYRKAGVDRRHFSKIRCDKYYQPKKTTAIALSMALELNMEQTEELLKLAGYSLSNSDTGDLVVKFCIERKIYDLIEVNEALDYFGQKTLGVVG